MSDRATAIEEARALARHAEERVQEEMARRRAEEKRATNDEARAASAPTDAVRVAFERCASTHWRAATVHGEAAADHQQAVDAILAHVRDLTGNGKIGSASAIPAAKY